MSDSILEYAIVDLETTGGVGADNKITEIAIIITDGIKTISTYTTLVNPERGIPPFISSLTGITDQMVSSAPKFYEIAKKVFQLLEGKIFVAHNVAFDSGVLKQEFQNLGGNFSPKKLCTVRLARKSFPGHKSYSLGKICDALDIPLNGHHRAMADTEATYILFQKILSNHPECIEESLAGEGKEVKLPPNLNASIFNNLPKETGVYYFLNEKAEIIYIGKSVDIKERVASHFSNKESKTRKPAFFNAIHDINYEVMGSEFIALLFESSEIKKHLPKFNRAQRRKSHPNGLFQYTDKLGYIRLNINKTTPNLGRPITVYATLQEGREHLFSLQKEFDLCPKLCGLQSSPRACFDYQIKQCTGACIQEESPEVYNYKINLLLEKLEHSDESFVLLDEGRSIKEKSFLLVENGIYKGYGFLNEEISIEQYEQFKDHLIPEQNNRDIQKIIHAQMKKKKYQLIKP